jgi:hypothetical protein
MAKKVKKFDRFQSVRETARERIGQPRPSSTDKRPLLRERILKREMKQRDPRSDST